VSGPVLSGPLNKLRLHVARRGAWVNSVYRDRTNGTANCNKLIYN